MTSNKLGKVVIALKNDKQMEDKPAALPLHCHLEPERTREEIVTLFMLTAAITLCQKVVYITLLILTVSQRKAASVYSQSTLGSRAGLWVCWLNKTSCFYQIEMTV